MGICKYAFFDVVDIILSNHKPLYLNGKEFACVVRAHLCEFLQLVWASKGGVSFNTANLVALKC